MARGKVPSKAQWRRIIEYFEASGKSQTEYAPVVGCHPTTLGWWIRRRNQLFGEATEAAQNAASCQFVELREQPVSAPDVVAPQSAGITLTTKAGTVVRFDQVPSAAFLAQLCQSV